MDVQTLIGVDIGGTKINLGKIVNGKIIEEIKLPTLPQREEKQIINDIIDGVRLLIDQYVVGIGIGVPGLVDNEKGIVYNLTNIPSWKEVHLKEQLEAFFNIPVQIANDANCFALGEKIYGKGQPFSNLVGITLGTGLGIGIIANNTLCAGVLSIAGEIAEMPYLDNNYEYYCSNKFFIHQYNTSAKDMFDKAKSGNVKANEIYNKFGNHLANLTKTIILAYGPEAIIFGGSLSKSFDLFYPSLMQNLSNFSHKKVLENLKIIQFTNEKIPLMGAAALSLNARNKNNLSEIFINEKN